MQLAARGGAVAVMAQAARVLRVRTGAGWPEGGGLGEVRVAK
jgi:hypothetical protein